MQPHTLFPYYRWQLISRCDVDGVNLGCDSLIIDDNSLALQYWDVHVIYREVLYKI